MYVRFSSYIETIGNCFNTLGIITRKMILLIYITYILNDLTKYFENEFSLTSYRKPLSEFCNRCLLVDSYINYTIIHLSLYVII